MKRILPLLLLLLPALAAACAQSSPSSSSRLVIFAAASLTEAFTDLAPEFENAHPGVTLELNFAGSAQLARQLDQGAPADLFASADRAQMQVAVESGRIDSQAAQAFATNRLVVITPRENPQVTSLQDLARPGAILVLAAAEVPVGAYSLEFLEKAADDPAFGPGFADRVLENVVSYEENVRAVLSKVLLGEADAGIVYSSDLTAGTAGQLQVIEIPPALNVQGSYWIAPLAGAVKPELAQAFIEFVLSTQGQEVLESHGFLPPPQP